jgi:hypothetical protein
MVNEDGDWAHVKAIVEGYPRGIFRLLGPVLKLLVKRSVDKDYARLKHILEKNPVQSTT